MTLVRTAVLQDSLVKIVTRFVPSLVIVAIVTGKNMNLCGYMVLYGYVVLYGYRCMVLYGFMVFVCLIDDHTMIFRALLCEK